MRFFGRAPEIERLVQALRGDARLITICGPGGIGKTRLAQELAGRTAQEHVFVELVSARSALSAIARALDLRPGSSRPRTLRRVREALAGASMLVLDGAEGLLDEVAELAAELTAMSPILVTSRESLRVSGEVLLELGPLSFESRAEMLLDRTTAARGGVVPGDDEQRLLAEIATDLDGIPLAIELAGSRLGVMSAATFASKLNRRFELLVSSSRFLDPRHRTLRAVLDASFDLLTEEQRRVLGFLSIFAGGFELASAEALLDKEISSAGVSSAIEDLHGKSWLVRSFDGAEPRFDMYETIRSYAAEHLEELSMTELARRRHADHFVRIAEHESARATRERGNMMAVLTAERLPKSLSARAAIAMEEMLAASESSLAHVELLDRISSRAGPLDPALAARLHLSSARARDRSGDARAARRDLKRASKLARDTGDPNLRFEIATFAVTFGYMHGELAGSVRRGRRTLALVPPGLAPRVHSLLSTEVGVALHRAGDRDSADRCYRRALEIAEAAGDLDATGRVLACIGFLRQDRGALDDAETAYRRALAIQEELGHRDVRGIVLGYLGNLERRRGRAALAESYYARALDDLRKIGDRQFEPVVRMDRALLLLDRGRWAEAEGLLVESMSALESVQSPDIEAIARSALALVEAKRGRFEEAHRLLEEAVARMPAGGTRTEVLRLHSVAVQLEEHPDESSACSAREALSSSMCAAESDDYVQLAAQLVEQSIARVSSNAPLLERTGAYFEVPGAERVLLEKREPLRRILEALVRARMEDPDRALAPEDLCRAAWPDEKIIESAAKNRVRVAVATLRSLGLRELLITRGSAYLLDPASRALLV